MAKSKTVCFRLQDEAWLEQIKSNVSAGCFNGRVGSVSDWLNKVISDALNHQERSAGKAHTHVYQPGDWRNGRPAKEL